MKMQRVATQKPIRFIENCSNLMTSGYLTFLHNLLFSRHNKYDIKAFIKNTLQVLNLFSDPFWLIAFEN